MRDSVGSGKATTAPGTRLTIRGVASLAGVSTATVSRVINGHADVSEETRATVMRVVREHGYSTSRAARGLAVGRTGLVSVGLPMNDPAIWTIVSGAAEGLDEHDMRVVLCPADRERDGEASLSDRLRQGTTDGALLIEQEESSEELAALARRHYPCVLIDPHQPPDEMVPTVSAAHSSGAFEAVEHLLALGHRRIAAITGPRGWIATEERLRGYRGALAAAGVMPDPELEIESDFLASGGVEAAGRLLDLRDPPTAVFAFNDMLAIGAMQAARARELRVPEDVSVVGFDDTFEASIVTPSLTTVRQPLAEMGRMAVALLIRLLHNQRIEALHVELETKLVLRDSTAPGPIARD